MAEKIRVLIVDDHSVVRLGLAEAMRQSGRIEVVGEVGNVDEALEKIQETRPKLVTVDLQVQGRDPIELVRRIAREHPAVKSLMLSVFEGEEDVYRAVAAGASGYVTKAIELEELLNAVSVVAAGGEYFSIEMARKLADRRRRVELTPRELEVLRHVVSGRSNKEILTVMKVSEATVKLHISNMLAKLEVTDRTQAAIEAVRRGIVHLRG